MPSTSKKQQHFMGMQLAKQRKSGHNDTGMSEDQLHDYAKETRITHGSLNDIDVLNYTGKAKLTLEGFLAEPGEECHEAAEKHFKHLASWEDREIKNTGDYTVEIVFHGPDTQFRAEELDVHQYGKDYEPIPYRDYYKTIDDQFERGFRMREQDTYDQTKTPGAVEKKGHGDHDRRDFDEQEEFARAVTDKKEHYAVEVEGIDTKHGKKFR